ncbi:hypothetical protein DQ356_09570 [Chryseobacterium lacus]|uniref:Uncharacterized protein n=1 Tax=Chryseobacterium lacus TaxID=2058346 RepID=A0A368MWE9_9FLAO|nr:MAG: hypothetical protein ABS44_19635 [Chryseobacterium sp. SCN 40-13]RCU42567.1 hypothetical protein DQ356_09570 [Chryseobacterium lacus]
MENFIKGSAAFTRVPFSKKHKCVGSFMRSTTTFRKKNPLHSVEEVPSLYSLKKKERFMREGVNGEW